MDNIDNNTIDNHTKTDDSAGRKENPYKGLFSYEEKDQDAFYGRKTEQRSLFRLVKHNFLTVVFGQSGIGKTSLLNAGLFPKIRNANFLPIRLRPDYSPSSSNLIAQVREEMGRQIEEHGLKEVSMFADEDAAPLGSEETLWEYFHRVRHIDHESGIEKIPVLVFDQFEEIFTIGKNHPDRDEFLNELYYLIENQYPEKVKERLIEKEETLPYADAKPRVRLVITLREDYLPHLNSLKKRVPSIDRITFRVNHLNGAQGREIIGMPGGIDDKNVIDGVLRMFYPSDTPDDTVLEDETLEIEPSILSLLCYQVMEKDNTGIISHADKNVILADFYQSVTEDVPDEIEIFIETKLLTEGGVRTPFYLEPDHPFRESIHKLVDRRVLRKVHYGKKEYIEIIHDVLTPVIREKRDRRLEKIKEQKLKEEIRKRNKKIINRLITVSAILSILLATFAITQWIRANSQFKKKHISTLTFEAIHVRDTDNVKAIRIAEAAYKMTLPHPTPNVIQALNGTAASVLGGSFYSAKMTHQKNLPHVAFSPDGSKILTGAWDTTAALWDFKGNRLVHFTGHTDGLLTAVFSADGSRVLTSAWDKTAKLWDIEGKCLVTLTHDHYVFSACFSPDPQSSKILTGADDNTARLWDSNGTLLKTFNHDNYVRKAVFSPDGTRILTASRDKTARLWDIDGNALAVFNHTQPVEWAVFSPDGARVLTASRDKTAALWDLKGKLLAKFIHKAPVNTAVFSPDGALVLTASEDKSAGLWDSGGNLLIELKHDAPVNYAVFSPDGSQILTASDNHFAALWDKEGNLLRQYGHNSLVYKAIFSRDGSRILTGSADATAKLWNVKQAGLPDYVHEGKVNGAVFAPNNKEILSASDDGTAKRWDLEGKCLAVYKHKQKVASAVYSPDAVNVLTASADYTAGLWDLKGKRLASFFHKKGVNTAVFSPDGQSVLTASADSTAALWTLKGKKLATFKGHLGDIRCALFSPDGTKVLTASADKSNMHDHTKKGDHSAKVWDLKGNLLANLDKHTMWIRSAIFSPDGTKVLTGSGDGTAKLWDLKGNLLADFKHRDLVAAVAFSPDGKHVLTGSADWMVKLWDIRGNLIHTYKGHLGWVLSVTFSPDGEQILTAGRDNSTKLWDLKGNLLADVRKHDDRIVSAVFSHDGTWILSASWDKTVKRLYTTKSIIEWLSTADIPLLTEEEEKKLDIEN